MASKLPSFKEFLGKVYAGKLGRLKRDIKETIDYGVPQFAARLASSRPAQAIENFQRFIESPQSFRPLPTFRISEQDRTPAKIVKTAANIPIDVGNIILGKGILDIASDVGRVLGNTLGGRELPTYESLKSGPARLGYQIQHKSTGSPTDVRQIMGNIAASLESPLTAYGGRKVFGMGRVAATQPTKLTLSQAVKSGLGQGVKYGGIGGFLQGLSEGRNIQDLGDYRRKVWGTAAMGAGAGAVFGSALSAAGWGTGQLVNLVKKLRPGISTEGAINELQNWIRDETTGKFRGSRSLRAKEPKWYSEMRAKTLGEEHRDSFDIKKINLGFGIKEITPKQRIALKQPPSVVKTKGPEPIRTVLKGVEQVKAPQLREKVQEQAEKSAQTGQGVLPSFGVGVQEKPVGPSRPSGKSIAQEGKYSFNINMKRLDLTPREKEILKTTIETVKPELESIKGKPLSNEEVIKAAKSSEMLSQITTREQTLQAEAALLKARQAVVSLDKDIDNLLKKKKGNLPQLQEKMADLIESLRVVSSTAADTGRKLQSFSIEAGDESIRAAILKDITKVEKDTNKILGEAMKVDWNDANSISAFYRKFVKPSVTEILDEYRYNNMLSNPRTHIRNAFSNLMQTFFTRPMTLLAQGKVGKTSQYYKGAIKALPDALDAFSKAFKGEEAILKPDVEHISTLKLPRFLTVPTRAMEAADRFFSTLIRSGELARGAAPEEAEKIAEYSLFRQGLKPEGQGAILNAIDNATAGVYDLGRRIPVLRWFVPFVRTPMNFAKQWIEYSPIGPITFPKSANKREQLAKTMIGSIISLMGAKLALDGNTTWSAPTDPTQKKLFYASGRKPYSVKIGNRWVSMMYAGPFAFALALPAAIQYYQNENKTALTDDQMTKLGNIASSMAELLSGQTFMEGLGNFVSFLRGDQDYTMGKNLGYTASQFIPLQGLVRWVSTIIDPVYRKAKTAPEQIMSTLPFVSRGLPAYTTPEGEPSTRRRINLLTPYDITPAQPEYEERYKQRTLKLQKNAVDNQIKKQVEESKGGAVIKEDKIFYWDPESSTTKSIDLSKFKEEPKGAIEKIRWEQAKFDTAIKIYRNESLSDEQKEDLIKRLGEDSTDLAYYDIASDDRSVRRVFVEEYLRTLDKSKDPLGALSELRRSVKEKRILTDSLIDDLVDDGVLTKEQGKYLKSIQIDSQGRIKIKGGGGAKKLPQVKLVAPKIKKIQLKEAKINLQPLNLNIKSIQKPKLRISKSNYTIRQTPRVRIPRS